MLITLADLSQLYHNREHFLESEQINDICSSSKLDMLELQRQFQLIVRQKQIGLSVESLLYNHPFFPQWLEQLKEFIPTLFCPNKKIYFDVNATTLFKLKSNPYTLQIPVNIAIGKKQYYLFEFGLRTTEIRWTDKFKLWTATRFLIIKKSQISLIICAFDVEQPAKRLIYHWSEQQHQKTTKLIQSLFNPKPVKIITNQNLFALDIDSIPEIAL